MTPKTIAIYRGKQIIGYSKEGKFNFAVLEDGTKIQKSELGEIKTKVQCIDCLRFTEIFLYFNIFKKTYYCQSCIKKGERNGFYGKTHSDTTKKIIGEKNSGRTGELNYMYGKKLKDVITPEGFENMRLKVSEWGKNREDNPFRKPMREIIGDEGVERAIQKTLETRNTWSEERKQEHIQKLKEIQKRIQERDPKGYSEMKSRAGKISASKREMYKINKFEKKVQNWLTLNEIDSEYSIIMNNGERNFQFDFKVKGRRILIECNGTYWHGDPRFYNIDGSDGKIKLNNIQIDKIFLDKQKLEFAQKKNFVLLNVWEFDINNNDFTILEEGLL